MTEPTPDRSATLAYEIKHRLEPVGILGKLADGASTLIVDVGGDEYVITVARHTPGGA